MYTEKIKEVVPLPIQKKILSQNQKYPLKQKEDVTQFFKRNSPNIFENKDTGLSDQIKMGIENLSGYSLDDVKVHYNSDKPAQLQALAYTQGTDIYVASGQEKYLPHEAWHVVQQKQGRVYPTIQSNGMNINQDNVLEYEADIMGEKALSIQMKSDSLNHQIYTKNTNGTVVQMRDDSVKIYADKTGQDPVRLGLTSHHVIPAEILEQFYNLCQNIVVNVDIEDIGEILNIMIKLGRWKRSAIHSANMTSDIRNNRTVSEGHEDYLNEVASVCQWMTGNIFIGSNPQYRIDDKEGIFDEGAYRQEDIYEGEEREKVKETNRTIDALKRLDTRMRDIIKEIPNPKARIPNQQQILTISEILDELKEISQTDILNNKRLGQINPKPLTYDPKDWISIGSRRVDNLEIFQIPERPNESFYNIYQTFLQINGIRKTRRTELQNQFFEFFEQHISKDKCKNLKKPNQIFIIARVTLNRLVALWKNCT